MRRSLLFTTLPGLLVLGLYAQAPAPAPAPAKPAAAKPAAAKPAAAASPVDDVIASVKAGLPESLIIKSLQSANKPMKLAPADLVKLKTAGVSDNVIGVMMDPASAPAPAAAVAVPAPAPPPPAPAPAPVQAPPVQNVSLPASAPPSASAGKKRVIIDEFDYSAVKTEIQAVFGTQQNIGKGIRSMLVTRVAKDNKLTVVERAKIAQITKEQDFNASNRVKQ